jgi:hypothetical protein
MKGILGNRTLLVLAALALFGVGCARNGTVAVAKVSEGDKAVRVAREADATVNAPPELRLAEDKLAQARLALDDKDYERAARWAAEASVDADYARAKAISEKQRKIAAEMQRNVDTLRREIDRLSRS